VLLSLVHLTRRPEEVGALVGAIGERAKRVSDRFITVPILCEIAVGDFQCPTTLARKICSDVIQEIEDSPWQRHRERLLEALLIGLFSPKVRDLIQHRIWRWIGEGFARFIRGGADHRTLFFPRDHDRPAAKSGIVALLDGCVESIHVHMRYFSEGRRFGHASYH
jgi:hypothetical protein